MTLFLLNGNCLCLHSKYCDRGRNQQFSEKNPTKITYQLQMRHLIQINEWLLLILFEQFERITGIYSFIFNFVTTAAEHVPLQKQLLNSKCRTRTIEKLPKALLSWAFLVFVLLFLIWGILGRDIWKWSNQLIQPTSSFQPSRLKLQWDKNFFEGRKLPELSWWFHCRYWKWSSCSFAGSNKLFRRTKPQKQLYFESPEFEGARLRIGREENLVFYKFDKKC